MSIHKSAFTHSFTSMTAITGGHLTNSTQKWCIIGAEFELNFITRVHVGKRRMGVLIISQSAGSAFKDKLFHGLHTTAELMRTHRGKTRKALYQLPSFKAELKVITSSSFLNFIWRMFLTFQRLCGYPLCWLYSILNRRNPTFKFCSKTARKQRRIASKINQNTQLGILFLYNSIPKRV